MKEQERDDPFMQAACTTCGNVRGVCCGDLQAGWFYCSDCCPHPYEARDDDDGECPGCGGIDGACSCFDDDEDDLMGDYADCHMHNGSCGKAGSEECDLECPNSRFLK